MGLLLIITFLVGSLDVQATVNQPTSNKTQTMTQNSLQAPAKTSKTSAVNAIKQVSWNVTNDSYTQNYNYTSSGWEFGPTPSYSITFSNGTVVGLQDTVKSSNTLYIDIKVPLSAITSGNGLGQVGFGLYYSQYGSVGGSPGTTFSESGGYFYDVPSSSWQSYSSAYNYTSGASSSNIAIFDMNTATRSATFNSAGQYWLIHMEGVFDSSVPAGGWSFNLAIMDSQGNQVQFGYNNYNTVSSPYRNIWVNAPYNPMGLYGDTYTTSVLSNSFSPLTTATQGIPFEYQVQGTVSETLSKVIWSVDLPNTYYYNSYQMNTVPKEVMYNGSWVWSSSVHNYVWDPTPINVTQNVQVNQTVQNPVTFDTSVNSSTVCPASNTYCYASNEKLFVIYDPITKSFSQKIGYELTWEDANFNYYDNYIVLRNVNTANSNDTLIKYNGATFTQTSSTEFTMNVNLTLSKWLYTQYLSTLYPTTLVNTTSGVQVYSYNGDSQININSPAAQVDVFDHNMQPAGSSLSVKLNSFFYVNMTLEGYSNTASLSAASLQLSAYDSWTTATASYNDYIQIIVRYHFDTKTPTIEALNQTTRTMTSNGIDVTSYYDQATHSWVSDYPFWNNAASQISGTVLTVNNAYLTNLNGQLRLSLNLSTSLTTPQENYWFQGQFEQGSFAQDYSAGQGLFTTNFPLNQQVVTLNGTYVNYNPYQDAVYYNNNYYALNQTPYIETSPGVYNDIKSYPTISYYDPATNSLTQGITYIQGNTGNYYYELTNGTKINTQLRNAFTVYTLQINGGQTVNSYSQYPTYLYNPDYTSVDYRVYTTAGTYLDFGSTYPSLTVQNSSVIYIGNNPDGYLLPLYSWNSTISSYDLVKYMPVSTQYANYDYNTGNYNFVDPTTNTQYNVVYNYTALSHYYTITVGGKNYSTDYTASSAYNILVKGQTTLVPSNYYGNYIIDQYFFVAGTGSFLPVNSNPAQSVYDLNNNVPIKYTFQYQGQTVQYVYNNTDGYFYFVFTNGTSVNSFYSFIPQTSFLEFNGTSYYVAGLTNGSVTLGGQNYIEVANATLEMVQNHITYYDYPWQIVYSPPSTYIQTRSDTYNIILGNPRTNMWGVQAWKMNPNTGALDLDGNLATTNDQFFVKSVWVSNNIYSENNTRMNVNIYWDPNTQTYNNEYDLNAWMGYTTSTYTWNWAQEYIWYYAGNDSLVSSSELQNIESIVFSNYTAQEANPGYWGISYMLINQTSAQLAAQAAANGWAWMASNTWTTSWLDFGFSQNYYTASNQGTTSTYSQQTLTNEWTGLFLYNDTNGNGVPDFNQSEVTHMFIPNGVQATEFTTPGTSLGLNTNGGSVTLNQTDPNYNKTLDFGVNFDNVTGTTYPIMQNPATGSYINIWDWQQGNIAGTDLTNFTNRPTAATINNIGFKLHFNIASDPSSNGQNAIVNLKLDQSIGDWNVSSLKGRADLKGYSLAITYLTSISTSNSYSVYDAQGQTVSNTNTVPSSSFSYKSGGNTFGQAILAGKYAWGGNQTVQPNSTTYSAPIGQFQSTYSSSNGQGTYGFNLQSTMYFLAIGFPEWDGYSVFQDPTFSAVAAVSGSSTPSGTTNGPQITVTPTSTSATIGQPVQLSWTADSANPGTYVVKDDSGNIIASGNWASGIPVTVTVTAKAGSHTYTITFYDSNNNSASSSVVVTGTQGSSTGTLTASSQTISSSTKAHGTPGFTFISFIAMIGVMGLMILHRRRK